MTAITLSSFNFYFLICRKFHTIQWYSLEALNLEIIFFSSFSLHPGAASPASADASTKGADIRGVVPGHVAQPEKVQEQHRPPRTSRTRPTRHDAKEER